MSDTAHDIQMRASRFVVEQSADDGWSAEDQASFDAWLATSTAHQVAYWRAKQAWGRADRAVALKTPSVAERAEKRKSRQGPLRVAAALGVLAITGVAASFLFAPQNYNVYSTPVGGRKILTLADGSRIELNTDTVLRLFNETGKRQAILVRGEAYFDIKHDEANPFTVEAEGRHIVDVGTKFLVRGGHGHLKVSMYEGAVILSAPRNSDDAPAELTAGDIAVATATSTTISKPPAETLADAASWRSGLLVFRHTTLAEAAEQFNRYNRTQLSVEGREAASLTISGKFRIHDVKTFAEVAQDVLHLHVRALGDKTVMTR